MYPNVYFEITLYINGCYVNVIISILFSSYLYFNYFSFSSMCMFGRKALNREKQEEEKNKNKYT